MILTSTSPPPWNSYSKYQANIWETRAICKKKTVHRMNYPLLVRLVCPPPRSRRSVARIGLSLSVGINIVSNGYILWYGTVINYAYFINVIYGKETNISQKPFNVMLFINYLSVPNQWVNRKGPIIFRPFLLIQKSHNMAS